MPIRPYWADVGPGCTPKLPALAGMPKKGMHLQPTCTQALQLRACPIRKPSLCTYTCTHTHKHTQMHSRAHAHPRAAGTPPVACGRSAAAHCRLGLPCAAPRARLSHWSAHATAWQACSWQHCCESMHCCGRHMLRSPAAGRGVHLCLQAWPQCTHRCVLREERSGKAGRWRMV